MLKRAHIDADRSGLPDGGANWLAVNSAPPGSGIEQELQRLRGVARVSTRCSACLRRPSTVPWTPTITSYTPPAVG